MAVFFSEGSRTTDLSREQMQAALAGTLQHLGERRRVLAIPPDGSRIHSRTGRLTEMVYELLGERLAAVMPALGTHAPMEDEAIGKMFGTVPRALFRAHRWRENIVTLGEVPAEVVRHESEGKLDYPWPAQVNRLLVEGQFDLILSLGQVVPHEVVGLANGVKNILVGTGGAEGINRSHYLGAVYGLERIMGRADTPVRRVLNYAAEHFLRKLPIVYVLTVIGPKDGGGTAVRGLFIGDDGECFEQAAALAREVNITLLDRDIQKAVVMLDPQEFHSTWLGNKAIYRTRMALADGAELLVLAPGVREFGEDRAIDGLIRRYGYRGTEATLHAVRNGKDLSGNLSAAAHLIHGSTENRFTVRYCPGALSRKEVEGAAFEYGDVGEMTARYDPQKLREGWNTVAGEEVFYIANPGMGLWASRKRFEG